MADHHDLYLYIRGYYAEHGYAPSYREMREGIGLSSISLVEGRLAKLRDLGYIRWQRTYGRGVALTALRPAMRALADGEPYDSGGVPMDSPAALGGQHG